MKKKKITEPLNHIQHQLLWNGKLRTKGMISSYHEMQNEISKKRKKKSTQFFVM